QLGGNLLQLAAHKDLVDVALFGEQDDPLADIVGLVEVAGPVVSLQEVLGPLGQVDIPLVALLPFLQLAVDPAHALGAAAAQGPQRQAEDGQGVVEVAADLPLFHPGDQVDIAGGNDPHAGACGAVGAVVQKPAPDQVKQLI